MDELLQAHPGRRHGPETRAQKDGAAGPGRGPAAGRVYQRDGADQAVALAAGGAVALNAPARSAALSFALHAAARFLVALHGAARFLVALQDQPASEAE